MASYDETKPLLSGLQQRRVSFGMTDPRRHSFPPAMSAIDEEALRGSAVGGYGTVASSAEVPPSEVVCSRTEARAVLTSAVPLTVTFLLEFSLTVASVFAVGRLGEEYLAAVSISSMTANITGFAIVAGVATCLDTLCAQAYGKGHYDTVGVVFVRCTYFLFALCVPITMLWIGAEPLLNAIMGPGHQETCRLAGQYLRVIACGLPGFVLFENGKHFLQAQGIFHASTIILLVCSPVNILLTYLLVWHPVIGLGFIGAPLAVAITNWLMCGATYAYIFYVNGHQCWPSAPLFDPIYFRKWHAVIRLAVPGILMVEAEWLAFEIITFTAAKFGTQVLAAQTILSTTCILLYQVPFAIGVAATTRIAWYVGARRKEAARTASWATMYASAGLGVVNAAILYRFRRFFAQLYTDDQVVVDLAAEAMGIAALYQLSDYLSCATGGILRGQGRQRIAGYINLICFYVVAIPLGYWFAFGWDLQLKGLWMGMVVGLYTIAGLQYYFVSISDWDAVIDASHK
ncbi:ethionine resistance-conferring protein 1 [Diutina catenulata]